MRKKSLPIKVDIGVTGKQIIPVARINQAYVKELKEEINKAKDIKCEEINDFNEIDYNESDNIPLKKSIKQKIQIRKEDK